jgi:hypothetical protein
VELAITPQWFVFADFVSNMHSSPPFINCCLNSEIKKEKGDGCRIQTDVHDPRQGRSVLPASTVDLGTTSCPFRTPTPWESGARVMHQTHGPRSWLAFTKAIRVT